MLNNGFCDTLQRRWGATASYSSTLWNYYYFLNCNLPVDTPVPGPLVGGDAQAGHHPPDLCRSVPGHSAQLHLLCGDSGVPELLYGLAALMSRKQNPVQTYMALKDFYSETKKLFFQPYITLLFHRNVYSKQMGVLVSMNLYVLMLVPASAAWYRWPSGGRVAQWLREEPCCLCWWLGLGADYLCRPGHYSIPSCLSLICVMGRIIVPTS